MLLYSGENVVTTTAIVVKETFEEFTSTVEVSAQVPIYGEMRLEIGQQSFKLLPLQSVKISDVSYKTLLVPKVYYQSFLKRTDPITGSFTLEEVLKQLNWTYVLNKQTQSTYWEIPKMSLEKLMKFLESKVSVVGGGGFCSTFNLTGSYYGIDLKTEFSKQPQYEIYGDSLLQSYDQTWLGKSAGVVQFTQDLLDDNRKTTFTFVEGFQEKAEYQLLANPLFVGLKEIILRNDFYKSHYTTNRIIVKDRAPQQLTLGALITWRGKNYVIYQAKIYQNYSADLILVSN